MKHYPIFFACLVPILLTVVITPRFISAAALSTQTVISAINHERESANLPELTVNQRLMQAAKDKLDDMAIHQYFDHVSPSGDMPWDFLDAAGYPYRASGENLARDYFNTTAVINAWLDSDSHRANLLSSVFKDVGVAIGTVDGHTVVVAMFGAAVVQPQVAGVATEQPPPGQQIDTLGTTDDLPDQLTQIITNNSLTLNQAYNDRQVIHNQSIQIILFLIFSIITAVTILTFGLKTY